MEFLWGVDLGGTKIEGVIMRSGTVEHPLKRLRIDTESSKGYEHILHQIKLLVDSMAQSSGIRPEKIGFGTPGILDPFTQTIKNSNTTVLNGKPLQKDLEEILSVPVVLANDANCLALAETNFGTVKSHAPDARMIFGVIMGTGVGGGIVFENKVWEGLHGIAGEWGHNFLHQSGGDCYCGRQGCVETILSGSGLQKFYNDLSGEHLELKQIVQKHAQQPSVYTTQTLERLYYFFGKAVASLINVLDPDVIVVGGGVGNIDQLYTEGRDAIKKFLFNNQLNVKILKPSLGDSAGVFGAAALVLQHR